MVVLQADPSGFVTVEFTRLDTEARYDVVRLYDGPDASAPLLGTYSGTSVPSGAVISSGPSLTVRWTSGQGLPFGAGCFADQPPRRPLVPPYASPIWCVRW